MTVSSPISGQTFSKNSIPTEFLSRSWIFLLVISPTAWWHRTCAFEFMMEILNLHEILSHECRRIHRRNHEHSPDYWMLSTWFCNVRHSFLFFALDLFTNSQILLRHFPMTKVSESALSWELTLSGFPNPSWIISSYLTECAFPSRRGSLRWGTNLLHRSPRRFIRFSWSIVRRGLTFHSREDQERPQIHL